MRLPRAWGLRAALSVGVVAAALLALYAVAGFWLAPRLIRSGLLEAVPKTLYATASVGAIHVNPFSLQASVEDMALVDAHGAKFAGFRRVFVDLDVTALWRRPYRLARIVVDAPFVHAASSPDGSVDLLALRRHPAAATVLPPLRIGALDVVGGALWYEDGRPHGFALKLAPIGFTLRDFATGSSGGRFGFSAASPRGERLQAHGHMALAPFASDGEFRLDALTARTLGEYLGDRVEFVLGSGTLALRGSYRLSGGVSEVDLANATLRDLTVRAKGSEVDLLTVPELAVTDTHVDLAARRAGVRRVEASGMKVSAWLDADGSLNWSRLLGTTAPAASPPAAPTPATHATPAPPWRFALESFELRDAQLSAEDRTTQPIVKLQLQPLNVHVAGVSEDAGKPLQVSVDTRLNGAGSLAVTGSVVPQPASADLDVKLDGIDLAQLQPYVAQHAALALLGGTFGGSARVHYAGPAALQVTGDFAVDQLHTVDSMLHDDFIDWQHLQIEGLSYTRGPDRVAIARMVAVKPYVRIIIEPDTSTNVKRVFSHPAVAARGAAPVAQPTAGAQPPLPLSIGKIEVQGGLANFSDLSVLPAFSAGIQDMVGSVRGLSSAADSRALIDLSGTVGKYSPVTVMGTANVLGPQLHTDVAMKFSNIELTIFNPYSGKFAGYAISKGKLTTDLHYKVDGRVLDAQHHIVLDQLEFGDKIVSKDAVDLPVKLAVAVLKDRNGIIDLNIPVKGSLDDPEFHVSPLVREALIHIVERAALSPFSLLASLFGGGPDIQYIAFAPGSGVLSDAAKEKAKTIAKALIERPELKIDVPIGVVDPTDRPALVAARYAALLGAVPSADPQARLESLRRVYRTEFGALPAETGGAAGERAAALEQAIRQHIAVGEDELLALGQQRALALQTSLLEDNDVDAERVFLVANDKAIVKDGQVQLELSIRASGVPAAHASK